MHEAALAAEAVYWNMQKASQSLRPQAQIKFKSFLPAACTSAKISHRRAGNPCVGQPVLSVLFALLSLAGDSPPASKRTKIPRKSKAVRCEAVLPEQKCSQTRKRPQRILCVFSRALTQYEGISARQNRVCPCQSTQTLPSKTSFLPPPLLGEAR